MAEEKETSGIEEEVARIGKEVEEEVEGASGKCPFCEIVAGNIPAKRVYEDDSNLAFLDINPRNPGHTLVIPKEHYTTIMDIPEKEAGELFKAVKKVATAVQNGMKAQGISISQSNGTAAGQLVPHLHFHIIPRFLREGPVALEGILSVKKMSEESLDKIMKGIKEGFGKTEETPEEEAKEEKAERKEIDFDF